jgi:hypothetical protein
MRLWVRLLSFGVLPTRGDLCQAAPTRNAARPSARPLATVCIRAHSVRTCTILIVLEGRRRSIRVAMCGAWAWNALCDPTLVGKATVRTDLANLGMHQPPRLVPDGIAGVGARCSHPITCPRAERRAGGSRAHRGTNRGGDLHHLVRTNGRILPSSGTMRLRATMRCDCHAMRRVKQAVRVFERTTMNQVEGHIPNKP